MHALLKCEKKSILNKSVSTCNESTRSKMQGFTEGAKGDRCSVITDQRLFCINGIKTKYQSIYWSISFCPSHLQPRKGLYLTTVLRHAACNTGDVCMFPSKGLGGMSHKKPPPQHCCLLPGDISGLQLNSLLYLEVRALETLFAVPSSEFHS